MQRGAAWSLCDSRRRTIVLFVCIDAESLIRNATNKGICIYIYWLLFFSISPNCSSIVRQKRLSLPAYKLIDSNRHDYRKLRQHYNVKCERLIMSRIVIQFDLYSTINSPTILNVQRRIRFVFSFLQNEIYPLGSRWRDCDCVLKGGARIHLQTMLSTLFDYSTRRWCSGRYGWCWWHFDDTSIGHNSIDR